MPSFLLAICLFVPGASLRAQIAFVNAASAGDSSGGSKASISASPAITVSSGNLLVVGVRYYQSGSCTRTVTISDTDNANSFTQIGSALNYTNVGCGAFFYTKNAVAVSSDTVTANFSPSVAYVDISVLQFSGADTSSPLDQAPAGKTAHSATATSNSFTPGASGEVGVAFGAQDSTGAAISAGGSYTIPANAADGKSAASEYLLNLSTASQTASMSTASSHYWVIFVATFRPSAGPHNYTATPSETNTTSDSPGAAQSLTRGFSDTSIASDSLARSFDALRGDTESSGPASDTLAFSQTLTRGLAETVSAMDTASAQKNGGSHAYSAFPIETASASDLLARAANLVRAENETASLTDGLSRSVTWTRGATESLAGSDSLALGQPGSVHVLPAHAFGSATRNAGGKLPSRTRTFKSPPKGP